MNRIMKVVVAALVVGVLAAMSYADGMIVPVRPDIRVSGHWAVRYHHVDITVRDQIASVTVDQEFVNTGSGMIEVEYMFPVPPEAAIDSMTLVVNGKEFSAKLYKADEARRIYESIVRSKKDPALLEYVGYGMLKTSAFPLEAGKPARVVVTYKSTCKKEHDLVEVWYPLNTEKFSSRPIDDVSVKVDIKGKADLTAVYSPTHDLQVKRDKDEPRHVVAKYEAAKALPLTDFQLFYREADEAVGATLLTYPINDHDGYLMLLVSPNPRSSGAAVTPKDVVLVVDHSGSMAGEKLGQAKAAVIQVLKNLNPSDRFNVVAYSDSTESYFDSLVPVNEKNLDACIDRVDRMESTGGTNIYEALDVSLRIIRPATGVEPVDAKPITDSRPKYILFMTDGLPTVGKTNEREILDLLEKANASSARVFAFGVGYDVNVRLLDLLSGKSGGKSSYVKPKEPIEAKISALYAKIKNPVMTDVKASIAGLKLSDAYPRELGDLFDGDQIVLVGRYTRTEASKADLRTQLVVTGKYAGKERGFEYNVTIPEASGSTRYEFVAKLWATRRIGYLLDQIQLHGGGGNKELIDEVVRLSRQYGIMTPYTSFLADERTSLADMSISGNVDRAGKDDKLGFAMNGPVSDSAMSGQGGQMGAVARDQLKGATNLAVAHTSSQAAPMIGNTSGVKYEKDEAETVATVRQVNNQAIYRRGNVWIASNAANLDLKKDAAKIKDIKQFSTEYFDLVKANSTAENQVLSQQQKGDELVIVLRSQAYRIQPAE